MASRRSKRVAELIRQEVALVVAAKLSDPWLAQAGITEVEMSSDLKRAFIYYSCPREDSQAVQAGFDRAKGNIKRQITPRLRLKFVPELVFRHDPSVDKGEDMDRLLASLDGDRPPVEE